ncbi:MAG: metallophosphoesterase family protein, partial [Candidatus Hydrothermia bacterium]
SLIRSKARLMLRGNHDTALFDPDTLNELNPMARVALEWTRGKVSETEVDFLRKLPIYWEAEELGLLLSHASPYEPNRWHYIFTHEDAERAFSSVESQVIITGHSHLPLCFTRKKNITSQVMGAGDIDLTEGIRYILNPGSVGQPRDGDSRAAYALLDTEKKVFSRRRVEYDIRTVAKSISETGLPLFLAERLFSGF